MLAFVYENPLPAFRAITGWFSFYAGPMDEVTVDEERVMPQEGAFYSGWITSELEGAVQRRAGDVGLVGTRALSGILLRFEVIRWRSNAPFNSGGPSWQRFGPWTPATLTVGTYPHFAPFSHESEGSIVGTDIELLERFAGEHGLSLKTRRFIFPEIWRRPDRGECDIAAAGIAILPEREPGAEAAWSEPYDEVQRSLLIRREDAITLRAPEDFSGKCIAATAGSTAEVDSRHRYEPRGAEVIPTLLSQEHLVRQLTAGEIDAYAGGERSNRHLVETKADALALSDIHETSEPETLHFVVRTEDPSLLEHLNAFLRIARPRA